MTTAAMKDIAPRPARYQPDTAADILTLYRDDPSLQDAPNWLKEIRYGALASLEQHGLPGPKLERWKYTNIQAFLRGTDLKPAMQDTAVEDGDKLVHKLWDTLADPAGWQKELFRNRDEQAFRYADMMLWDLNSLFLRDGIVVDVPAGRIVGNPLHVTLRAADGELYTPRVVIRLGEGARLTVLETHEGQGRYWQNGAVQIVVGKNAQLHHYRLNDHSAESLATTTTHVRIAENGRYDGFMINGGGAMTRSQIHAKIEGPGASCNLYGVNILNGAQHSDITAEVEHTVPHCTSNQFVRSVLSGRARGVFQGKVHVHQAAQKTDAYQLSNALILSEGAEMDTKPELEIYADDVKCSHGATTGRLEDEALFYLRSRGIPETEAQALLIAAFVGEVVDKSEDEAVKPLIESRIQAWLNR